MTQSETIASAQFWESGIRHALEDHQFIGEYIPIISLAFWQRLSPALQEIFTEVWRENIQTYRANMSAAQLRARELVQSHGVRIAVPTAQELAAKREEMRPHQQHVATLSKISAETTAAVSAELAAS